MKLSIIVITKNNQSTLEACLNSAKKADEIIIVDDFSIDQTLKIAHKFTDRIFSHKLTTFAGQRNWAATKVTGDWLIFLDADERITQKGFQEIKHLLGTTTKTAFRFKRLNYFSGKAIKHGGFWPDYQTRLFKRKSLKSIKGVTHEQYIFDGELGTLKEPVLHFPDRGIKLGLHKSMIWTPKEAKAFVKSNHPPITWWRLVKVMVWEFFRRYIKLSGWKDGYIGFVESLTQAINKFFIYQQVWELQNKEKIATSVKKLEKKLL